jgi:flagellar assembly protein FliH
MTSSFRSEPLPPREFVADPLPRPASEFHGSRPGQERPELGAAENPHPDPEQLLREAYERGREAGRGELPWQEAEALESAQAALTRAARTLDDERRGTLQAQRETVIELALAVARRILEREVSAGLDGLEPLLERALALLGKSGPVVLYLAPADLETLRAGGAPALEQLGEKVLAGIEADPELRPGDARLSAGSAGVDASVDTILAHFRSELGELVRLEEEVE